jgi:hypothetical protein
MATSTEKLAIETRRLDPAERKKVDELFTAVRHGEIIDAAEVDPNACTPIVLGRIVTVRVGEATYLLRQVAHYPQWSVHPDGDKSIGSVGVVADRWAWAKARTGQGWADGLDDAIRTLEGKSGCPS